MRTRKAKPAPPLSLAMLHAALGKNSIALDLLENAMPRATRNSSS